MLGLEHKLGIHASPTCSMAFGDNGGATGWLIGEENKGLACMFTMMNAARLGVGVQGVGVAEAATQKALAYARERRQGKAVGAAEATSPIVAHPDVQRMLLTMRAYTQAARSICYLTAAALDAAHGPEGRAAHDRASLLTPIAKAFSTDLANEVTSLGVQVHGGMGFVEETGAAQLMRDARILGIYEGTNGIQAIDLTGRKLPSTAAPRCGADRLDAAGVRGPPQERRACLRADGGAPAGRHRIPRPGDELSAGRPRLEPAGDGARRGEPVSAALRADAGGACLAKAALAASAARKAGETDPAHDARIALARFYAENLLPAAGGLAEVVLGGAAFTEDAALALAV